MRKAIGYVRISKAEKGVEGLGPQSQREAITRYCEVRKLQLSEIVEDIGVSGGKPISQRDGGQRLLSLLKTGEYALIALKQDRLFRSNRDAINTMHDWRAAGVLTALIAESLDLTTPSGRLSFAILAAVAEYEREIIGERTKAAMDVKRRRGERISRHAPFGKRFVPSGRTNAKGEPVLVLKDHPEEQAVIDEMLDMQAVKYSYRRIAEQLNRDGHKPRHGSKWIHTSVRKILAAAKLDQAGGEQPPTT